MLDKTTVRGLLVVALLLSVSTVSRGQDITYDLVNYPADQVDNFTGMPDIFTGSITTDGTIGPLSGSNILAFNFGVSGSQGAWYTQVFQPLPIDPNPSGIGVYNLNLLEATPTQLLLEYGGQFDLDSSYVVLNDHYGSASLNYFNGVEDDGAGILDGYDTDEMGSGNSPPEFGSEIDNPTMNGSEPWVIAQTNPVPEPSIFALFIAGVVVWLLGYAWRRKNFLPLACMMVFLVSTTGLAQADVFNMGGTRNPTTGVWTGLASLSFVTVGDPGNLADTTGFGSVPYVYQMGKYDVTVGQYCQFLNAVAKTDTYGLYNNGLGGPFPTLGIEQSGSSGNYSYSVTGSYSQGINCPIFDVSWGDAARFCNWLQNGQPSGPEGPNTTEAGSYDLSGATSNAAMLAVTRSSTAIYAIPTENEWYKSAYYIGGGTNTGYWTYPTKSNTGPINTLPDAGNHANYYDILGTGDGGYTDPTNYLTPVGAFPLSPGPYGTFDQGGDVWQWDEDAVIIPSLGYNDRGLLGGSFTSQGTNSLESDSFQAEYPSYENWDTGFRVESVPEPSTLALLIAGAVGLLALAWRSRGTVPR